MIDIESISASGAADLVSVIVPIYNVEAFLPQCLGSISSQTYSLLEIILIDDGSTDGSPEICDQWALKDSRIKVIHQRNRGLSAARNRGLDIATGNYILFVDSDDYVSEDLVYILHTEIISDSNPDCVVCGFSYVGNLDIPRPPQAVSSPVVVQGIEAIKDLYLYKRLGIPLVNSWGKLFRRELWEYLRFTDGIYYEDLDIMPFLYTKCQKIACVPNICYFYNQRPDSISRSTDRNDRRVSDSLMIRDKHIAFYKRIGQYELAAVACTMLMDLIITSDICGWIPQSDILICHQLVRHHFRMAIAASSGKNRLRYLLYRFGGIRIYRLFAQRRKGVYL